MAQRPDPIDWVRATDVEKRVWCRARNEWEAEQQGRTPGATAEQAAHIDHLLAEKIVVSERSA